ncbi:hypothetical protein KAF25_007663 [Fusarium avenaceum]|uniref:Uncharacterized protein n=1 Tax=Fusarium avenaceum TaxID=40199 RepID=A0A9P7KQZ3_9HYPO|nr:hypothetical protein KAF25_007663 [Fusarium avenaceum]
MAFHQVRKMTSRRGVAPIPLPPRDPTLESQPVPWERQYLVRTFGPGAALEAQQNIRSLAEFKQQPLPNPQLLHTEDDAQELFRLLTKESNFDWREDGSNTGEQTWGPTIIVTAHSAKAKKNIDKAIENLFDVIEDGDLENASDDRVREHFNTHVRSLRLFSADHRLENQTRHWYKDNLNRPQGPKRYTICIILDKETIDSLAAIKFPETLNKDKEVLKDISIKVVDRNWRYPEYARDECGLGSQLTSIYAGTDMLSLELGRFKIDKSQRLGNHVVLVVAYPDIPVLDDTLATFPLATQACSAPYLVMMMTGCNDFYKAVSGEYLYKICEDIKVAQKDFIQ